MAKSGFGMESVLRLATAPLPKPVQYALGSKFRFYLALVCIAAAMFFGVIHFGWNNGRPSVTVDRQKLQEIRQEIRQDIKQGVNQYQQNNPNSALAPLVSDYLNKNLPADNTPPNYAQQPNNGYRHQMVYPQQPNYQQPNSMQPLTGAPQPYSPMPYQHNQYQPNAYGQQQYAHGYNQQPAALQYGQQPAYGQQPQYGNQNQYGTGYSNPHATQPSNYPQQNYNQYPTSAGYPNNTGYQNTNPGYQNYGQPARTSVPQYSAPGYR